MQSCVPDGSDTFDSWSPCIGHSLQHSRSNHPDAVRSIVTRQLRQCNTFALN